MEFDFDFDYECNGGFMLEGGEDYPSDDEPSILTEDCGGWDTTNEKAV